MKLTGALVILGATLLLLTSGGDCGICPAIKEDVHLFLFGTPEEYVNYVEKYKDDPETLENTEKLKICVDRTLTKENKEHAAAFIEKIESSPLC
ncbi:androgen-binding protein eta precursor [Mus musculus]|uniref:ABPA2 n=4 Tax=Mus TaxID=862507 RepID=O35176_MOUSE|nr:androgen-binding protein eta precursor [Mus musculus]QJS38992.1 ABPA2 [Mus spretus]QNT60496.1 ABPA2 [Mus musculus castaneus]QPF16754.1 ABPA2 [Mus musculus domesticus]AAB67069.1 lacrimal androgen-binding protein eta [Mus musculus]AAI15491.1 Androgen-binding protein eta [Mus musculus]|eukprot:NP_065588.1 androgen-binding protein eta precursor [Mus musculus]